MCIWLVLYALIFTRTQIINMFALLPISDFVHPICVRLAKRLNKP